VTAILHVKNIRDIPFEGHGGRTTAASRFGVQTAKVPSFVLLAAAYGLVIAGVLLGTFVRWSALVVLSAPLAWTVARKVGQAASPRDLAMLDVAAARLHLVFGLLLVIGVLL
jgi:1,4-dihydroxy-2-naphthoate octaprenyltransferase